MTGKHLIRPTSPRFRRSRQPEPGRRSTYPPKNLFRQAEPPQFWDLSFAAYTFPALTTVRIDRRAIGRIAADAILARMDGRADMEKVIDIGFEVIERAST